MLVNLDTYIEALKTKRGEFAQITKKTAQTKIPDAKAEVKTEEVKTEVKEPDTEAVKTNPESSALWKRLFAEETLVYWSDFIAALEREQMTFALPQIVQRVPLERDKSDYEIKEVQEPLKGTIGTNSNNVT
jgi:hypothetical protein